MPKGTRRPPHLPLHQPAPLQPQRGVTSDQTDARSRLQALTANQAEVLLVTKFDG